MYIRDSLYNTLFLTRLPLELTSFRTGQIAKEDRTHTVNTILKSAHFLVTLSRTSWHDTHRVTIVSCPMPSLSDKIAFIRAPELCRSHRSTL